MEDVLHQPVELIDEDLDAVAGGNPRFNLGNVSISRARVENNSVNNVGNQGIGLGNGDQVLVSD